MKYSYSLDGNALLIPVDFLGRLFPFHTSVGVIRFNCFVRFAVGMHKIQFVRIQYDFFSGYGKGIPYVISFFEDALLYSGRMKLIAHLNLYQPFYNRNLMILK